MAKNDKRYEDKDYKTNSGSNRNKKGNKTKSRGNSSGLSSSVPRNNDLSWYFNNPDLLRRIATLPSGYYLGKPYNLKLVNTEGEDHLNSYIPGITTFTFVPTIGTDYRHPDRAAINLAAKSMYVHVRQANSRTASYDAADLMLYLLAADSINMGYAHLKRAYGLIRLHTFRNLYMPDTVLTSLGFNPDEFRRELPLIRAALDRLAIKMNTLRIPIQFPYFQRHAYLCSEVYSDEDNVTAQMYAFKPHGLYWYNEFGSGQLTYEPLPETISVFDYIARIEGYIELMRSSQDVQVMAADIENAYGAENMVKMGSIIPEDYMVIPVYNPIMLNQIHNMDVVAANVIHGTKDSDGFVSYTSIEPVVNVSDITQIVNNDANHAHDGCIKQSVYVNAKYPLVIDDVEKTNNWIPDYHSVAFMKDRPLDFPVTNPTPEMIAYATRLRCTIDRSGSEGNFHVFNAGSEVVVGVHCYSFTNTGKIVKKPWFPVLYMAPGDIALDTDVADTQTQTTSMVECSNLTVFPWETSTYSSFPMQAIYTKEYDGESFSRSANFSGGVNCLCEFTDDELKTINEFAFLGLFGIKQF